MGHCVTGLLARPEVLTSFAAARSLHAPVLLPQDLALLPLRDDDIDSFVKPSVAARPSGFRYLSDEFVRELAAASQAGAILYFETDYAGGAGTQGAAVFDGGVVVFGPVSSGRGPINRALAYLGVRIDPPASDEFESVGLHRRRRTEDWVDTEE